VVAEGLAQGAVRDAGPLLGDQLLARGGFGQVEITLDGSEHFLGYDRVRGRVGARGGRGGQCGQHRRGRHHG
jgi:hypothetical protein